MWGKYVLFVDSKLLTVLPWQWYLAQQQVSIYIPCANVYQEVHSF